MASFKLNMARIRGCPRAKDLVKLLEEYGLPEKDEFGILKFHGGDEAVNATLIRRTLQTVQQMNPETKDVTSRQVEKVNLYPFMVMPGKEVLEIYAGSAGGIKEIGEFFGSCLALPTVVEGLELDVVAAIEKLAATTQRFQLRSIRVSDYSANSFMIGPYTPKFADSEHGKDFLAQYAEAVTTASVRFQGPGSRVTVSMTPKACFSFSCHEDDPPAVRKVLRGLLS